jgi:hypothetical protein
MNWDKIFLDTFIGQLPTKWNKSFDATKRYIDIFYDGSTGRLRVPLETSGRVKGARGEFVTLQVDNLVVRSQFTNLFENSTTADLDFVNAYNGQDASLRAADASEWEYTDASYIDVISPYYKVTNDASLAFQTDTLGLEFQLILNPSVATTSPYTFVLDHSTGSGVKVLTIPYGSREVTYVKLICNEVDPLYGASWVLKEFGGNISINVI